MVYCGKPSEACDQCRKRRIKVCRSPKLESISPLPRAKFRCVEMVLILEQCNKLQPKCTQCSNKSITSCSYRNQLDLYFRDESKTVVCKFKSKQKSTIPKEQLPRPPKQACDTFNGNSGDPASLFVQPWKDDPMSLFDLAPTLEEIATCHFFSSHILDSHFRYLPGFYTSEHSSGSLNNSVYAAALATLSVEMRDPAIMKAARNQYTTALAQVNQALAKPDQAIMDSTLISVLLLSLFETFAQEGRKSPTSWTAHTQGAAALLSVRGRRQFETALGRQLFVHVTFNLRVSCAQRAERVPQEIVNLQEQAMPFLDCYSQAVRGSLMVESFAALRAHLREHPSGDPVATVRKAMAMQQELVNIQASLPPDFRPQVIPTNSSTVYAFGPVYHKYTSHQVAQRCNSIRMMQIFINNMIYREITAAFERHLASPCPSGWLNSQELALRNSIKAAEDICASVPQFAEGNSPPTISTVIPLLWPLCTAAESSLSPPALRSYIIDRLHFLGGQARVPQATWAAQMLEDRAEMEDW